MKFEEILKFINIDSNFYNLLIEYKNNPKLYEKEVITTIIEKTKYNKEAIKILTSNYSNSSFLKEYIGKNDKEIFERMSFSAIDEKNNSEYFHEIYNDILKSENVANGLKISIASSIVLLSNNQKYGKNVNDKQKEYGKKSLNIIKSDIIHKSIKFEDVNWISEIFNELSPQKKINIFYRLFNLIKNENIENFDYSKKEYLKLIRKMYINIIHYLENYVISSKEEDETIKTIDENKKKEKIENIKNLFGVSILSEGKDKVLELYKIGEWFVNNMNDKISNVTNGTKRIFDENELILSFSNIIPEFQFLTLKEIENKLNINEEIFISLINKEVEYMKSHDGILTIISNLYNYFKNTKYEKIAIERLFQKTDEQFEEMKEISKIMGKINFSDKNEIKDIFNKGELRTNKSENYEINYEKAQQIKRIPNFRFRKDYNSFLFYLNYEQLIKIEPEKTKELLSKLFSSNIDLSICDFVDNTGNSYKNPFLNEIVKSVYQEKIGKYSHSTNLKNNIEMKEYILDIYLTSMNEYQKNKVINYLFDYILSLEILEKKHTIIIDDYKKYKGEQSMLNPLLNNINSYYKEQKHNQNKEIKIFNIKNYKTNEKILNEYFLSNNKIDLYVHEEYIINNYLKYMFYNDFPNEKYKNIIDKNIKLIKEKYIDKIEQNSKINQLIKYLLNDCFEKENKDNIGEYIYNLYFDEIKEENDIISMIKYAYFYDLKSLQNKIKMIELGTTPKGLKISALIKEEENKLNNKNSSNIILPAGIISIDNEKRKEAMNIIDSSLENLFKIKTEKHEKNKPIINISEKSQKISNKKIKEINANQEINFEF